MLRHLFFELCIQNRSSDIKRCKPKEGVSLNETLYNKIWNYVSKHKDEYKESGEQASVSIYNDVMQHTGWRLPDPSDVEGTREVFDCIKAAIMYA